MLVTPEMLAERAEAARAQSDTASAPAPEPGPFQDIPASIWRVFLSAWGLLFLMFFVFFAVNRSASFMVTVAGLFAIMAFGLPSVLAAQGRCEGHDCGPVIQTHTGPLSVRAAGLQIVLIPIGALIGLTVFIALAL